ncbi:MAG: hypothetical protein KBT32_09535 [Bacteroidales bacterium]|nr:hypothetical protein [Candidatus Physcocola equi]
MKLKIFGASIMMAFACESTFAVTTVAHPMGVGNDSVNTIQNLSFLNTYVKQGGKSKNYADAVAPFEALYPKYPAAHKSIYIYGPRVIGWQIAQEQDPAKKTALFNKMMKLYDDRITYFSDKPDYYIIGRKAIDYINYSEMTNVKNTDPLKKKAYEMLKDAINKGGEDNELAIFSNYYSLARAIYDKETNAARQQFVDDYLLLSDKLSARVAQGAAKDSTFDQLKGAIDMDFGRSGAADCAMLNQLYSGQIDAHKSDKAWLQKVLSLYDMADCDNSAAYFKASEYLYKIEPTYTAASGLAANAFNKGDINGAITYLNEACKLTPSKSNQSNIKLKIATLYNKRKNAQSARDYARQALALNPNNGSAYILIGQLYAAYNQSISSDPFVQTTAYWAAVDKFEKAKAVDPNCAAMANKLIAAYKNYFPAKKDCFMRNISGSYQVPGWIGETTTVRYK